MKFGFKFSRSEKGVAFAEMALVIPILLVFIGAVFEISRAYYLQLNLEYATKEAAKMGTHVKVTGTTVQSSSIQNLVVNSAMVSGVVQDTSQFMLRYFTKSGTELFGPSLPFDRTNNPTGSVDLIEVKISYPGTSTGVNTPVPALFNPAGIFMGSLTLISRAVFQIDG